MREGGCWARRDLAGLLYKGCMVQVRSQHFNMLLARTLGEKQWAERKIEEKKSVLTMASYASNRYHR